MRAERPKQTVTRFSSNEEEEISRAFDPNNPVPGPVICPEPMQLNRRPGSLTMPAGIPARLPGGFRLACDELPTPIRFTTSPTARLRNAEQANAAPVD